MSRRWGRQYRNTFAAFVFALAHVASECRAELETHCANVEVGEGRVAQCLKDHASDLSPGCNQALIDVGVQ